MSFITNLLVGTELRGPADIKVEQRSEDCIPSCLCCNKHKNEWRMLFVSRLEDGTSCRFWPYCICWDSCCNIQGPYLERKRQRDSETNRKCKYRDHAQLSRKSWCVWRARPTKSKLTIEILKKSWSLGQANKINCFSGIFLRKTHAGCGFFFFFCKPQPQLVSDQKPQASHSRQ